MTSPSPAEAPQPIGTSRPALVARTVAVPVARVGDLLALLPEPHDAGDIVSWVRKGEGFVGWGTVATFRAKGESRFAEAQQWWRSVIAEAIVRDDVDEPGSGPIAFGSMAYSADSDDESVLKWAKEDYAREQVLRSARHTWNSRPGDAAVRRGRHRPR